MVRCGDRYSEECRCITDGECLTDTPADLRDFFRPLATLPVASARPDGCASPLRCRVATLCLIAATGEGSFERQHPPIGPTGRLLHGIGARRLATRHNRALPRLRP